MFANRIFHPYCAGEQKLRHGPELLRFTTSVSWRVLHYAYGRNSSAPYTVTQRELIQSAEETWREFLLGKRKNVRNFCQHIIPFGLISESTIGQLPTNMNRFIAGAVTLDIIGSRKMCMTFAKLGPFIILGHIQGRTKDWIGSRVWAQSGTIPATEYHLPWGFLPLLKEKALHIQNAWTQLSPDQAAKIDERIQALGDAFFATPQGEAILADAAMFGLDAIKRN
ncbi:hypothetical protein IM511_02875 [Erythrobacteraceae bacterium E2-1 Yellow Sea]|nr:hypothetical protein [Erythrobacteraceae bacterium E2-1 Yellow Sea]